jgi:hypothetical protein
LCVSRERFAASVDRTRLRRHGVALPCSGDWGLADAEHDPHNRVTLVVCNLREGFDSEAEWNDFRRRNG